MTATAQRVRLEERLGDATPTSRFVAVMVRDSVSVAVELSKNDEGWSAMMPLQVPRLYKAFPLVSTADFCLPVVINSEKFDPREDRDTLILRSDREGKNENMILMEGACDLAADMPVLAANQGWAGVPALGKVNPVGAWDWADGDCGNDSLIPSRLQTLFENMTNRLRARRRLMIHAPLIDLRDQFGRKTYPDEPFSPSDKRATTFFRHFLCFLLHGIDHATPWLGF